MMASKCTRELTVVNNFEAYSTRSSADECFEEAIDT